MSWHKGTKPIHCFAGGMFWLVAGVILGYLAYREWRLDTESPQQPEEITLKNLIARGTNGNNHVVVTDYVMCCNFVYEHRQTGSWTKVWIPIIPREHADPQAQERPAPRVVHALILSTRFRKEEELIFLERSPPLQGLVINKLTSLGKAERRLLEQSYPETNFSECLIIQERRKPGEGPNHFVLGIGGSVCLVLGVGLLITGLVIHQKKNP